MNEFLLGTKVEVREKYRTYTFIMGAQIVLENVFEVIMLADGSHRLRTKRVENDQEVVSLHVIQAGWLHIEIEPAGHLNEWKF
jgi:hypothetical protein